MDSFSTRITLVAFGLCALVAACAAPTGEEQQAPEPTADRIDVNGGKYSPVPTEPGERCVNKLVCRYVHANPPLTPCYGDIRGTDCEMFCDYKCEYLIDPLPTVNGIGSPPDHP